MLRHVIKSTPLLIDDDSQKKLDKVVQDVAKTTAEKNVLPTRECNFD